MEPVQSLTDEEIVTERKVARRSFLASSGAVLAGAAGLVAGLEAATARTVSQDDPKPKPADPPPDQPPPDRAPDEEERRRREREREREKERERRQGDPDKPPPPDAKPPDPHRG